jgi:hypothetical protein
MPGSSYWYGSRDKLCSAVLDGYRAVNPGQTSAFEEWKFSVALRILLKLVGHFESTNVHFEVFNNNALYVYDEDGPCTAQSLLCFLTQAQANTLKERNARAAAAVRRAGYP